MKTGYDQFFKQAQKVAANSNAGSTQGSLPKQKKNNSSKFKLNEKEVELELRRKMNLPTTPIKKKKSPTSWKAILFSVMGIGLAFWGVENHEKVDSWISRVEIGILGQATAQESAPAAAPATAAATTAEATSPAAPAAERAVASDENDFEHLKKIKEKTKELELKEEELSRIEKELALQKEELEKRMLELEKMRTNISQVLEDRVQADAAKVDTLVQVYTNMKPVQAAKVIETIDEDLAVEILSRMKKKNAADIMNMLKPEKAQVFTEKLAGFKK
ncbi:MAG: MotE family protein [Bdellovibrionia bacterium]